jgi:phosphatidylinositol glycan class N
MTHLSSNILQHTKIAEIEELMHKRDWYNARRQSAELIKTVLEGLRYLQTYALTTLRRTRLILIVVPLSYDRLLIRAIVIAAYTGWAAYASLFIFRPDVDTSSEFSLINLTAASILSALWILFALQRSPWTFYLYVLFPVFFWTRFFLRALRPLQVWFWSRRQDRFCLKLIFHSILVFAALQCMVVCP